MTARQQDLGWKVALVLVGTLLGGGIATGKDWIGTSKLESRIEKRIDQMEQRFEKRIDRLENTLLNGR